MGSTGQGSLEPQRQITWGSDVPVGVSNRHIHLSGSDVEVLFGEGYNLSPLRYLKQEGEFAANEVVTVVGPRGVIEGVRVLGPSRTETQVEISVTDSFRLGIKPPVRESGDIDGTPGIAVVGPNGVIALRRGVILAARHIHMHVSEAEALDIEDGIAVRAYVPGPRAQTMENIIVRVSEKYHLELHIDTDEANASLLQNGDKVQLLH